MKRALALSILLIGFGCKPKIVYVQTPCPPPPQVQPPILPITTLKPTDTIERERVLWVATVEALDSYCKQLEAILNGYRPKTENK